MPPLKNNVQNRGFGGHYHAGYARASTFVLGTDIQLIGRELRYWMPRAEGREFCPQGPNFAWGMVDRLVKAEIEFSNSITNYTNNQDKPVT